MNSEQLRNNRDKAYRALHGYANALSLMGYNKRCIQDSIAALSVDLIIDVEGFKE